MARDADTQGPGRARSFAVVAVVYAIALSVFPAIASSMDAHALTELLAADLVATLVVFAASVTFDNTSMYDAYWSVAPPVIVAGLLLQAPPDVPALRQFAVLFGVTLWGVRLTANWARGWPGLHHEDWRYAMARDNGRPYWVQSFLGFHLFPTLIVFLCLLPTVPAVHASTSTIGPLDGVALLVMVAGAALELVADEQLRAFNRTKQPGEICTAGLWAWCRHPNYLGEMTFWWGVWLAGLAADPSWWWTVVGPIAMTAMFRFASIPMLDERSLERRPGYAEHVARVPAVLPRPPRSHR